MKKLLRSFFLLCCIFSVYGPEIVKAESNQNETITPYAIKYITRYYSRSEYSLPGPDPFLIAIPNQIIYDDGYQYGVLNFDSWYISLNDYVVTYRGHVGPYASSVRESEVNDNEEN